jgi:hypothetical protein
VSLRHGGLKAHAAGHAGVASRSTITVLKRHGAPGPASARHLTDAGAYNFLNESEDERRYQWSCRVPVGVSALIALLVVAVLLVS